MECRVYDKQLNRIAVVNSWVSMVWEENYNDIGSFQIELIETPNNVRLFVPDNYCGIAESDTLMIIKAVEIADGTLIASGYSASWLLSDRVSTAVVENTTAETALRILVQNMAPIDRVEVGTVAGVADKFTAQKSDASLLDYCCIISQAVDMGFKFRHDKKSKKLLFECYKPAENPNAKFSTAWGNLSALERSDSTANIKNVAVVAGAGEGKNRVTVYAGAVNSTGLNRHEMYVDARQEQPKENESDADYRAQLVRIGEEKLVGQVRIENYRFVLNDDRVKLGDVATCLLPEFGVKLKARITTLTITSQNNGVTVEVGVGEPIKLRRG